MDGNYEFMSAKMALRIFLEKSFAAFALGSFLVFFLLKAGGIAVEAQQVQVQAEGNHDLVLARMQVHASGAQGD